MRLWLGVALVLPAVAFADDPYHLPPNAIVDLVDAPTTPAPALSPDRKTLLLAEAPSLPSIAEVAAPERRLAGLRFHSQSTAPSKRLYYRTLSLLDTSDPRATPRPLTGIAAGARIQDVGFSPDGKRISFTITDDKSISLWTADVATRKAARLAPVRLSGVVATPCRWLPDSRGLVCRLVPDGRGRPPAATTVPRGPIVLEAEGTKKPARTYQDLLKNADDAATFEYYATAQLARVGVDGRVTRLGKPDLYLQAVPSPDGKYLLVKAVHRPFSYRVPVDRFPERYELWSADGKPVKTLADNPLAEDVPIAFDAVRTGPRAVEWRADADAAVCWAEARDGGDPKRPAEVRDEVLCLDAPFSAAPATLARLEMRYSGTDWGDAGLALVSESRWQDRKTRTFAVAPGQPGQKPQLVWDRSSEDAYKDPGDPVTSLTPRGTRVMARGERGEIYLAGMGATPEGNRPFLDRFDARAGKSERIWRAEGPSFEFVVDMVDGDRFLTRRETASEPPQYWLRTGEDTRQLTRFPHPSPQLAQAEKRLIRYKRADGVDLSGVLYTPPGYQPGKDKPLPLLMWAYPAEFKSAEAAGQVRDSPYRFIRVSPNGPLFLLTQGYAILENPTFPIVGEGKTEPNDTYVKQLVVGAEAAANEVVRLGVADRDRLAIGGHSYGAFTAANLLAHSKLFRAGVARSGAYNRTLTPFGFQAEERVYWEARATYGEMSPFTYADKIDEPLLLIHGEADDNTGTFPIQSQRLFEALQGLGGRARLVVLPAEAHGYRARESVLHVMWEMLTWLDTYVKNAPPRKAA